jgi:hypothetical protein
MVARPLRMDYIGNFRCKGVRKLLKDFAKCNVLIYDNNGQLLTNAKIWEHNISQNYITVKERLSLVGTVQCNLLILTAPAPYSYKGTIVIHDSTAFIKLSDEHIKENRKETRYKTNLLGTIESLIYDGKSYPLLTALETQILDISRNGLRIFAKNNTLNEGDRFIIKLKLGENDKLLTGMAVNSKPVSQDDIEYGCRLVSKDGGSDE